MKPNILIITANFYEDISSDLSAGAIAEVKAKSKFKKIIVPGVFEIPVIIAKNIKKYHGFIALGCVIKGETPHFDFISTTTINAIMNLSIVHKKPIGNGILTCLYKRQAKARSGSFNKVGKGTEAAKAVLSVLNNS